MWSFVFLAIRLHWGIKECGLKVRVLLLVVQKRIRMSIPLVLTVVQFDSEYVL